MVRVSITLAGASTVDAGYATRSIANNAAADIYRTGLKVQQQAMAQRISQDVLGGEALDVVWNMTLLTNTISANVPYGKIEAIEALDGVASVTLENRYEPVSYTHLMPASALPRRCCSGCAALPCARAACLRCRAARGLRWLLWPCRCV